VAFFFICITWMMEVRGIGILMRQYHAESFSKTEGRIAAAVVGTRRDSKGSISHAPTLQLQDGSAERLTDLNRQRAEAFAAWLREQLGLPTAPTPD
jgi:hypothetical protein